MLFASCLFFLAAQPADAQYQRGAGHFRNGRVNEAIAAFEEGTRLAPTDARSWKGLGVAHAAQGNYKKAEDPLWKACELDARDPDACYYLGLASYNLGRYENALDAYNKALKAAGDAGRVHTGLGLVLEAQGKTEAAEGELREASKITNGKSLPDSDPRVEFGAFLFRQGRIEEALPALDQAARARPDSPRAHFELARILVQKERLDEAVSRLKRAVTLDPAYGPAHLLLGRVYFRQGRVAEGEQETRVGQKLSVPKP